MVKSGSLPAPNLIGCIHRSGGMSNGIGRGSGKFRFHADRGIQTESKFAVRCGFLKFAINHISLFVFHWLFWR